MASTKETEQNTRDLPFYTPHLQSVNESLRKVLEEYSGIPPNEVLNHLTSIRERAWDIHPYPCIGQWRFANLNLSLHPGYPSLLLRLKNEENAETFLDLGCCFGQDVRKLIYDGVSPSTLYGAELRGEFLELGFELFKDKEKLKGNFFTADIFDPSPSSRLAELKGKVDIIYAGSFFHLFDWEGQVEVGKKVVELLRPRKGSLLLGRQVGTAKPGVYEHRSVGKGGMYRHDAGTFEKLWEEIGKGTGSKWKVDAELMRWEDGPDVDGGDGNREQRNWLVFAVERL